MRAAHRVFEDKSWEGIKHRNLQLHRIPCVHNKFTFAMPYRREGLRCEQNSPFHYHTKPQP